MESDIRILAGNSHPELAKKISEQLSIPLVKAKIDQFSNTEVRVLIEDGEANNLRNKHIFIIQTGGGRNGCSINDYIMETLLMIDACKRSSSGPITLIMPCYPYARQDKKDKPRSPISASMVAKLLEVSGISRLVTMDLHASQIAGFFTIPVDNLYAIKLLAEYVKTNYLTPNSTLSNSTIPNSLPQNSTSTNSTPQNSNQILKLNDYVLVSPDAGGIKRMDALAKMLEMNTVIMHKQRSYTEKSLVLKSILIGDENAVRDKICIIVDDMCDTGGTICQATNTLIEYGARMVKVLVSHGILSGQAIKNLYKQPRLDEIIVSNSLPMEERLEELRKLEEESREQNLLDVLHKKDIKPLIEGENSLKISIVDTSGLLSKIIKCLYNGESVSALFPK